MTRDSGGRARMVASISAGVCCAMGVLHLGQATSPAREEEPQVVVNFGDRGDGAARVRIALSLVDGDRGLEAVDVVDVGPLHLIEELPGVDREALDVLPLPLGEQRVEGERAFAGAAHAR